MLTVVVILTLDVVFVLNKVVVTSVPVAVVVVSPGRAT